MNRKEDKVKGKSISKNKVIMTSLVGISLILGTLSPTVASANTLNLPVKDPTATIKVLSFMAADIAKPFVDARLSFSQFRSMTYSQQLTHALPANPLT
jgi:hypothetical protein